MKVSGWSRYALVVVPGAMVNLIFASLGGNYQSLPDRPRRLPRVVSLPEYVALDRLALRGRVTAYSHLSPEKIRSLWGSWSQYQRAGQMLSEVATRNEADNWPTNPPSYRRADYLAELVAAADLVQPWLGPGQSAGVRPRSVCRRAAVLRQYAAAYGRIDYAFIAYRYGRKHTNQTLYVFDGAVPGQLVKRHVLQNEDPVRLSPSWANLILEATPDRHPRTNAYLRQLQDEHDYWSVLLATRDALHKCGQFPGFEDAILSVYEEN